MKNDKYNKIVYGIFIFILWFILCIRYGQGSDYFSYNYLFEKFSDLEVAIYNPINEHGEIGFRILCAIFPGSFQWFIVTISTFEMIMLDRCIRRYSVNPIYSLLIFYPTYYMTYYFSIIRQGIVIALFIGLLLEYIETKKWIRYYVLSVLAITIHSTAVVLLIIPLLKYIRLKHILYVDVICAALGIFMSTSIGIKILSLVPQLAYYASADISFVALLERILMFIIIMVLYFYRRKYFENQRVRFWVKIYAVGIAVYLVFLAFPLISSRFMALFKVMEILLLPKLLDGRSKYREFVIAFVIVLGAIMTCKNLDSYLYQGNYHKDVKFYNYPYISVFNKDEIWEYRDESQYNSYLNSLK